MKMITKLFGRIYVTKFLKFLKFHRFLLFLYKIVSGICVRLLKKEEKSVVFSLTYK